MSHSTVIISAYNPKSSDYVRKKYKQKLHKFEETCQLIRYLGDNMTVRYRAPNDRPGDFDNKLETFFALRGIEPTKTWMVWSARYIKALLMFFVIQRVHLNCNSALAEIKVLHL